MINHKNTLKKNNTVLMFCPWQFQKTYFNLTLSIYLSQKKMSLNDARSLYVKQNEVGRKKAIRNRALIIPKRQRSSYQRNIFCELDVTNNVFSTLNMLPLHNATDTMYANIPVATPEAIQTPYNMLYRSIQNLITLQQQSIINKPFNTYIDQ